MLCNPVHSFQDPNLNRELDPYMRVFFTVSALYLAYGRDMIYKNRYLIFQRDQVFVSAIVLEIFRSWNKVVPPMSTFIVLLVQTCFKFSTFVASDLRRGHHSSRAQSKIKLSYFRSFASEGQERDFA